MFAQIRDLTNNIASSEKKIYFINIKLPTLNTQGKPSINMQKNLVKSAYFYLEIFKFKTGQNKYELSFVFIVFRKWLFNGIKSWRNIIPAKFKSGKKSVLFMVVIEFKIWK